MKNKITISLQYPHQDPVIFFERAFNGQDAASAFKTAKDFINKNMQSRGRKMPLIKMEATAGTAPVSMSVFYNQEQSSAQTDVFLFGNLNVLLPNRKYDETVYTSRQPKIASQIIREKTLVRIPVGA